MTNDVTRNKGANWRRRREALLKEACADVAGQVQKGVGVMRALRATARKFRGRSLGEGMRLELSGRTLTRLWYRSKRGTDQAALRLRYVSRNTNSADPVLTAARKIAASLRGLDRRLRKSARELERSARRTSRSQIRFEGQMRQLCDSIHRQHFLIASMKTPRKPRIQGKIAKMPREQHEQIHAWFRQNLTYSEIADRIRNSYGLKVAASSLCGYYHSHYDEIFPIEKSGGNA